jgi:hypothetical protein
MPTDPPPERQLDAFLAAHALGAPAAMLYGRGEALHAACAANPPAVPAWGRFLVALGALAAEGLGDDAAAGRWFQAALSGTPRHGDGEAAITAGYNLGVLHERRQRPALAVAGYRAAIDVAVQHALAVPAALRAVAALAYQLGDDDLTAADARRFKLGWLLWFRLEHDQPTTIDAGLRNDLERTLAVRLLDPEHPDALAAEFRAWPGDRLDDGWRDGDAPVLTALYRHAAAAADTHLGADAGAPWRLLGAALARLAPALTPAARPPA